MWFQNTVFTVDNIKSSFMSRFFKWKKKDLLCFCRSIVERVERMEIPSPFTMDF